MLISPEGAAGPSRPPRARKKRRGKGYLPYLYLLPILVFAAVFTYQPFFRVVVQSLGTVGAGGKFLKFVGLDNYRYLFGNGDFQNAFAVTMKLAAMFVPLNLALSLTIALLCSKKRRLSPVYEMMFLLPMAISMSALSMIFQLMLNPTSGIVNHLLGVDWGWFSDPRFALYGILLVCLWMGVPFDSLVLLAAMRNIPPSMLEAATMDGAGPAARLFYIRLPVLSPMIFYIVCTDVIASVMTSGPVMIITEGGPSRSTTTLIYMMYTSGFQSSNYSLAACISIFVFALTLLFTLLAFSFEKKVYYQ